MVKINNDDYKYVIKALNSFQAKLRIKFLYTYDTLLITRYNNAFSHALGCLRQLYIDYHKDTKVQNLSSHGISNLMLNLGDIMDALNAYDLPDIYLKEHIMLAKAWLTLTKYANSDVKHYYDKDAGSAGSLESDSSTYQHDVKQMQNELNYYWDKVKKYSWNYVSVDSNNPRKATVNLKAYQYANGIKKG